MIQFLAGFVAGMITTLLIASLAVLKETRRD